MIIPFGRKVDKMQLNLYCRKMSYITRGFELATM